MNGNLISALRNMVDDIEKLGAGPLTVDVTILKQAVASLTIAQRTSSLVDAQNLLLSSYESALSRQDKLGVTAPPEGYVLVPVEPTGEMLLAMSSGGPYLLKEQWAAMLAARPGVSP